MNQPSIFFFLDVITSQLKKNSLNIYFTNKIYIYPKTTKSPKGKLRLLYECNPLAFIIEQAGGVATDGYSRILELDMTELHQRTPLFLGSTEMMKTSMNFMEKYKEASV